MSDIPPPMERSELLSLAKSARQQQQVQASLIPILVGFFMLFWHYSLFRDAPKEVQRMVQREVITAEASTTTLVIVRSIYGLGVAVGIVYVGVGVLGVLQFGEVPSSSDPRQYDRSLASDFSGNGTTGEDARAEDASGFSFHTPVSVRGRVLDSQTPPTPAFVLGDPVMKPRRQAVFMLWALALYLSVSAVYAWFNLAWLKNGWIFKAILILLSAGAIWKTIAASSETGTRARVES